MTHAHLGLSLPSVTSNPAALGPSITAQGAQLLPVTHSSTQDTLATPLQPQPNPSCPPMDLHHAMETCMHEQADEITTLKARLATLEPTATQAHLASSTRLPLGDMLFTDPATINHARAAATTSREEGRKLPLPDLVPGFKVNPLRVHQGDTTGMIFAYCTPTLTYHDPFGVLITTTPKYTRVYLHTTL